MGGETGADRCPLLQQQELTVPGHLLHQGPPGPLLQRPPGQPPGGASHTGPLLLGQPPGPTAQVVLGSATLAAAATEVMEVSESHGICDFCELRDRLSTLAMYAYGTLTKFKIALIAGSNITNQSIQTSAYLFSNSLYNHVVFHFDT